MQVIIDTNMFITGPSEGKWNQTLTWDESQIILFTTNFLKLHYRCYVKMSVHLQSHFLKVLSTFRKSRLPRSENIQNSA